VTKRGACRGRNSKISWTQVETGSAITWKYPSVILQGDNSIGEFYSVALTNQRAGCRYRNEDDSPRQKYEIDDYLERNFGWKIE
jgi:Fe-S cluster assembly scaffold protein SufB